jgi:hypothetical protein
MKRIDVIYVQDTARVMMLLRNRKTGKARVWIVNMDVEARQASEVP